MASRKIEDLVPELQEKYHEFATKANEAGVPFTVTCTARSLSEQIALWIQGRALLYIVNEVRKACNLPPITDQENARSVTWTLNSKHLVRLPGEQARAFDVAVGKGQLSWNLKSDVDQDSIPDYDELADIGESVGLVSGRSFSKKDYPHFELAG